MAIRSFCQEDRDITQVFLFLKLRLFKFLPAFQRLTFNTSLNQSKYSKLVQWKCNPVISVVEESVHCNAKQGRTGGVQEISVI